jgi:hypothetical protein
MTICRSCLAALAIVLIIPVAASWAQGRVVPSQPLALPTERLSLELRPDAVLDPVLAARVRQGELFGRILGYRADSLLFEVVQWDSAGQFVARERGAIPASAVVAATFSSYSTWRARRDSGFEGAFYGAIVGVVVGAFTRRLAVGAGIGALAGGGWGLVLPDYTYGAEWERVTFRVEETSARLTHDQRR